MNNQTYVRLMAGTSGLASMTAQSAWAIHGTTVEVAPDALLNPDITKWLDDNTSARILTAWGNEPAPSKKKRWFVCGSTELDAHIRFKSKPCKIVFESNDDALLYKLTWGGAA